MCFVVNKFLHLFQVLRNFQNTATAINAPPSPLQDNVVDGVEQKSYFCFEISIISSSLDHDDGHFL